MFSTVTIIASLLSFFVATIVTSLIFVKIIADDKKKTKLGVNITRLREIQDTGGWAANTAFIWIKDIVNSFELLDENSLLRVEMIVSTRYEKKQLVLEGKLNSLNKQIDGSIKSIALSVIEPLEKKKEDEFSSEEKKAIKEIRKIDFLSKTEKNKIM